MHWRGWLLALLLLVPGPVLGASTPTAALRCFPVQGEENPTRPGVGVQIETDRHGAIVAVHSDPNLARPRIIGYLCEAGSGKLAPAALELTWDKSAATPFRVEGSNDLSRWQRLAEAERTAPARTLQSVDLPDTPFRYLRLTFPPGAPAPELHTARLHRAGSAPPAIAQTQTPAVAPQAPPALPTAPPPAPSPVPASPPVSAARGWLQLALAAAAVVFLGLGIRRLLLVRRRKADNASGSVLD